MSKKDLTAKINCSQGSLKHWIAALLMVARNDAQEKSTRRHTLITISA